MNFKEYLQSGRDAIEQLAKIEASEPAFADFVFFRGAINLGMVQFHPKEELKGKAEVPAAKIARAFGGRWHRENDGSWMGDIGSYKVVIHSVYTPVRAGADIDLSDPSLAPVTS